jgi:hypothetical protein
VFGTFKQLGKPLPGIERHLASPIARVRYYAADHFGQVVAAFKGRAAELQPVLADPDATVVAAAVWALRQLRDPAAVPWITPLLRHPALSVRATTVGALCMLAGALPDLVAAIREGAGELTLSTITVIAPVLNPALYGDISDALVAQLAQGVTLAELMKTAPITAAADFVTAHGDAICQAKVPPGSRTFDALYWALAPHRWAAIWEASQLTLTTHEAAAAWWEAKLEPRFAALVFTRN